MSELTRGDRVTHATFGSGVVESVGERAATVRFGGAKPKNILITHLERQARGEPSQRATDTLSLFDAYLMVDWSANSKPKNGADSVWYCLLESAQDAPIVVNPRTRQLAFQEVRALLVDLVDRGQRTLVGFDFPYGFPHGTGARLGLSEERVWRPTWNELSALIEDDSDNQNNRFVAAGHLNGGMTAGPAPFWGCPKAQTGPFLRMTKPKPWPQGIAEFRRTDRVLRGPKSVWQLYGAGSVGSQALVGIPRLAALRDDPALEAVSEVWPFENAGAPASRETPGSPLVVHAEIYPSLVAPSPLETIKDAGQVRALAEHFAQLDDDGSLSALFDLTALSPEFQVGAGSEEGWILGVTPVDLGLV